MSKNKAKVEDVPKEKMVPADRIYHRLIWDDRIPVSDFDLGYEDRFKGILFLPLTRFRHTGDETTEIPFHRVRLFRYKGDIIWDRENRIDVVDSIFDENGVECLSSVLQSSITGSNPLKVVKRRVPRVKNEDEDEEEEENGEIKIASINALFDRFNSDKIFTPWRVPLIDAALDNIDADIIGIQEVTSEIYQMLRGSSQHLRDHYYWTYLPEDVPSSQIILSKYPILESVSLAVSKSKRVIFALLDINSTSVVVCNCHLVSDFGNNPAERRVQDLKLISDQLAPFPFSVLLGDFNFGDQGVEQRKVAWGSLKDTYLHIHEKNPIYSSAPILDTYAPPDNNPESNAEKENKSVGGFTYDVSRNPLAALSCEHNKYPRRLDRILVKGMDVEDFELFADTPSKVEVPITAPTARKRTGKKRPEEPQVDYEDDSPYVPPPFKGGSREINLFPSDHFGICAKVKLNFTFDEAEVIQETFFPCFQAAMCIIPPKELHEKINKIREKFDQGYPRWMPHINVLHPFVQFDRLADAITLVDKALQGFEPFTVSLKKADFFDARKNIVFIAPETSDGSLQKLHSIVQALFPACVKERGGAEYNPHLTLGQVEKSRLTGFMKQFQAGWEEVDFVVDEISVVGLLDGSEQYEVLHTFKLSAVALEDLEEPPKHLVDDMVMEFPKWGNRLLQKYAPEDQLERWMLKVSQSAYARDAPTHISQKGAMYHIPSEYINEYLHYWKRSIEMSDKIHFYMEEIRGAPFRLYIDIDLKRTIAEPADLSDVIRQIVGFTHRCFPGCESPECIALDCHGDWNDQEHTDAVYKSGYRLFFQKIFVDDKTFCEYLEALLEFLTSDPDICSVLLSPHSTPKGMEMDHICDVKSAAWDRGRLMGTIKRRHALERRYKFFGVFTSGGMDEEATAFFKEDIRRVLYGITLRLWNALPSPTVIVDNNFTPERMFTSVDRS
ncbi:endonuclease/exonuclease/phosphatase domain-containing protein [Angomonas deanei]|uniref:MJ1316 RNA cyclic group end recognition domain/2'-5' RNA ligase superfamily/Prim-pol 4, putative n=1 Tax=Angomonas deanei TaxID=59799 RepID=A0A7G2CM58_9TRYP|nr:endonuclease/exonuclease/phosphatase domain-containing protein [Angomonas deanei]CAD2220916.1 MJ1316 RNA cyclic group end recognition domain/2'-5' RNA ligase superfamily/Prim-pol 4, putative [Angomonas deanei]|eukprot:EPY21637.1 endonuclease/exonuclease/phosphatase domain-containing protein [Angomonas deanei]